MLDMTGTTVAVILTLLSLTSASRLPLSVKDVPDYDCPPTNDVPTLYANPEDCHSYYLCNFGELVLEPCPNGLEFSDALKACEFPDVAQCELSGSTLNPPVTTDGPPVTNSDVPETTKPPVTDSTLPAPNYECPPTNEVTVLYPSPYSCSDFYICNWGSLVLEHCQAGLEYSIELKACEYPEVAKCDLAGLSTYTPPPLTPSGTDTTLQPVTGPTYPAPDFYCPPTNDVTVLYPSPYSCSDFYICNWGQLVLEHCQAGLEYNIKNQACEYPQDAQCDPAGLSTYTPPPFTAGTGTTGGPPPSTSPHPVTDFTLKPPDYDCPPTNDKIVLYPSPYSCSDFYICDWGQLVLEHCLAGLEYNNDLKACVDPSESNCQLSSNTPPPVTEPTKGTTNPPDTETPAPGTTETPAPGTTSIPGVYCPPDSAGSLVRNPEDCNTFYECNYGIPQLETCPPGLVFSLEAQSCDYPANVPECSDG